MRFAERKKKSPALLNGPRTLRRFPTNYIRASSVAPRMVWRALVATVVLAQQADLSAQLAWAEVEQEDLAESAAARAFSDFSPAWAEATVAKAASIKQAVNFLIGIVVIDGLGFSDGLFLASRSN